MALPYILPKSIAFYEVRKIQNQDRKKLWEWCNIYSVFTIDICLEN